jgi:hypothetical protein
MTVYITTSGTISLEMTGHLLSLIVDLNAETARILRKLSGDLPHGSLLRARLSLLIELADLITSVLNEELTGNELRRKARRRKARFEPLVDGNGGGL